MKRLGDLLPRRISRLNLGRADDLEAVQVILDKIYTGRAKARSLNGGVLKITTQSASIASDLRLRQVGLLEEINKKGVITNTLIIRIGG